MAFTFITLNFKKRRTADVVSKGFANLFTLAKADLEETLKHYPDAKRILNAKVLIPIKNILDRDRVERIIKKII